MQTADYEWLVSDDGQRWLEVAEGQTGELTSVVRALRRSLPAARVHLLLEQLELRRRAAGKFTEPDRLFFTAKGLQQASDQGLAQYKAARFARGVRVHDLCCGIGGDLLGLGQRGPVVACDLDPATVVLARANCRAAGCTEAEVRCCAAEELGVGDAAAWHVDPDRRAAGRRVSHPDACQPSWETLAGWLRRNPQGAVKLAPAAQLEGQWQLVAEREWLGSRGECRQQVAWFGELARTPGRRVATLVEPGQPPRRVEQRDETPRLDTGSLRRFLFEPHNAVLAADLLDSLAAECRLSRLAADVAYLMDDAPRADPALACFEVQEVWPWDGKRVQRALNERGIGILEIKKRGTPLEPQEIRRRLRPRGERSATLLVFPRQGRLQAVLARRVT